MTGENYLAAHSLAPDFAKEYGLTWDENELHIPVKDQNGQLLFFKHRNLNFNKDNPESQKYRYDSGSKATLFNYHAVKERSYMVISEGEIDCLRLMQEDIPSVSSTGGAQKFDKEWAELLENKTVFVCLDNDKAGQDGTKKIVELIPEARIVKLPKEAKDISDWFTAGHHKEEFITLLKEAQIQQEPEDYQWISDDELRAMKFPEEQWLIDKVVYSEGFCFIYGAEGVGKSFVALSLAQAVATGQDWLGHFKVPKAGKVLFIDKENPKPMLARRISGMNLSGGKMFWLKYPEKLQLANSQGEISDFAKSIARKVEEDQIDMVVIDSFVDLMVGNENSASDTQVFFDTLKTLIPHTAFVVLHHENKPSQGVYRSDSQRTRGSSNINAQTVTQFRLEAVAKSRTELTLKQTKARDSQKLDKFMIRMLVEDIGNEQTAVTGFLYVGVVESSDDDSTKIEEAKNLISDMLSEVPAVNRKEIIQAGSGAGISESTLDRVLKEMIGTGLIEKIKKGRDVYFSSLTVVKEIEE